MAAVLLSPHNDDETLFASFLVQKFRPHTIVCLRSQVQADRYGITAREREQETKAALAVFGTDWQQLPFLDREPPWDDLRAELARIVPRSGPVFAPAPEENGHEQHNAVGQIALELFGHRVIQYLTYTRTGGRSRSDRELEPEPRWIERKHRALACYRSQIREPSCRPWFLGDLREYLA